MAKVQCPSCRQSVTSGTWCPKCGRALDPARAEHVLAGDPTIPAGPSGWYLDERDAKQQTLRWWDGTAWTDRTRALEPGEEARRVPTQRDLAEERKRIRHQLESDRAAEQARSRLAAIQDTRLSRDGAATKAFEYSVVLFPAIDVEAKLNEAGSLGWELVEVQLVENGFFRCFMKREVWARPIEGGGTEVAAPGLVSGTTSAAAGSGGGFFAAGYFESGPDFDGDGDVDGGLMDSLGDIFG